MRKILYILILFVLKIEFGFCQNPHNINYTINDDLPTNTIYCAFEDSNGYMWFGSDVGVLKFDGYQFQLFTTDNGLGDNEIFQIFEDSKNRIWFLTLNGNISFYQNDSFHNELNTPYLNGASHQKIMMDVFEDKMNSIYFLYGDGLVVELKNNNQIKKEKFPQNNYFGFLKENDRFSVVNRKGINKKDGLILTYNDSTISNYGIRFLRLKNKQFFASKNIIYEYYKSTFSKTIELEKNTEIIHINKIDSTFWVGTLNGVIKKNTNTELTYFKNDKVSSIIKDQNDNYWLTSLNNGIRFIPNINITSYRFNSNELEIRSIKKNDTKAFIGTSKNIYTIDTSFNIKHYKTCLTNPINNFVKNEKNLFVSGDRFTYKINGSRIDSLAIKSKDILFKKDSVFIASSSIYQLQKEDLNKYYSNKKGYLDWLKNNTLINKRTNCIIKIENEILLGTSLGLFWKKGKEIIPFNPKEVKLNSTIHHLYYDAKTKILFVSTNSNGLLLLKEGKIIYNFNRNNGLNNNSCNIIKKIDDNYFLLGTNRGLNSLRIENGNYEVKNLNPEIGISGKRINAIEVFDDEILLGLQLELLQFKVSDLKTRKANLPFNINEFSVNSKPLKNFNELNYNQNNITLTYTGISFKDFGNLVYEYKINDDNKWTITNNRQLDFKNLPPDKYSIQLRAKDDSGNFSKIKTINFTIKPPFWKTTLFKIALILFFVIISWLVINYKIKSTKKRLLLENETLKANEEKMLLEMQTKELEQKALRMQMNPHFIFNALNTIKGYYAVGEINEANKYINDFAKLLRLILESDETLISLEKEIEILELYIKLLQLRYKNLFEYEISIDKGINTGSLGIPPMLIQPFVENAIIHGMVPNNIKGKLYISFTEKDNYLLCKVTDNGVGLNHKKESNSFINHQSKAIKIIKQRLTFYNQSNENITISNRNDGINGTEILVKIKGHNLWET